MLKEILVEINPKIEELKNHHLYKEIDSIEKLRIFMENHIFAVFDFMSLTKALQFEFAPINKIWTPPKNRKLARFINEIVLVEETDLSLDNHYMSHFEMYCLAMNEVKANSDLIAAFVHSVDDVGLQKSMLKIPIPKSAHTFLNHTMSLVENGEIHKIAASFCFGREKIIPKIFSSLLEKINVKEMDAPIFYYYLKRHIEVDGETHGPLALEMISNLCGDDSKKWLDVKDAALFSIEKRIEFWDQLSETIKHLTFNK